MSSGLAVLFCSGSFRFGIVKFTTFLVPGACRWATARLPGTYGSHGQDNGCQGVLTLEFVNP
jgi:hypothetical protein